MKNERKNMEKSLIVKNVNIRLFVLKEEDFISLTDIARYKNSDDPRFVVQNWMKTRSAVEFLGLWEIINNPNFNRVEFDTFKNESGSNAFVLTPQKWIKATNAIGIISKSGRYGGGTFAYKDITFEFASWISAEFKLYIIKEFQRLKKEEQERNKLDWSAKRFLVKANYKVHTDAVQENLIPEKISKKQINCIYAKEWRAKNQNLRGNIRDHAKMAQLVCLAGLESLNAEFIRQGISQIERLKKLNRIAIIQMKSLSEKPSIKRLK